MALVLIIVGLVIGGILKGWEMVQSTRVRTLAATTTSVQSAFFAFSDRYAHVAGDWNAVDAGKAIGEAVNGGGDDSRRLDTPPGDPWTESNAFWEQLAKARFVNGAFQGTAATEPTLSNNQTPMNVFGRPIIIGRTPDFVGATGPRRHVLVGRGVPVTLLRELDIKLDDGNPGTGKLRSTLDDGALSVFSGTEFWGGADSTCVSATPIWDVDAGAEDCNGLLLF